MRDILVMEEIIISISQLIVLTSLIHQNVVREGFIMLLQKTIMMKMNLMTKIDIFTGNFSGFLNKPKWDILALS